MNDLVKQSEMDNTFNDFRVDSVLTLKDVVKCTTLSSATIYRRIANNTFPKQVHLGGNRVGWLESEIQKWLKDLKQPHAS